MYVVSNMYNFYKQSLITIYRYHNQFSQKLWSLTARCTVTIPMLEM